MNHKIFALTLSASQIVAAAFGSLSASPIHRTWPDYVIHQELPTQLWFNGDRKTYPAGGSSFVRDQPPLPFKNVPLADWNRFILIDCELHACFTWEKRSSRTLVEGPDFRFLLLTGYLARGTFDAQPNFFGRNRHGDDIDPSLRKYVTRWNRIDRLTGLGTFRVYCSRAYPAVQGGNTLNVFGLADADLSKYTPEKLMAYTVYMQACHFEPANPPPIPGYTLTERDAIAIEQTGVSITQLIVATQGAKMPSENPRK